MMLFRSLSLGLLGAIALLELAQLHAHLHDRDSPEVVLVPREVREEPAPSALDRTVIVDMEAATCARYLEREALAESARTMLLDTPGAAPRVAIHDIRPNSLLSIIGLESGDVLTSVDDAPPSPDAAAWFAGLPGRADSAHPGDRFLDLEVMRRGEPLRIIVLIH